MSSLPKTHVVLLPSAGMGHLTPFLRLAALLFAQNKTSPLTLTLITTHPTVSLAESSLISRFLSAFPDRVTQLEFHLLPLDPSTVNSADPFWLMFESIRRSAHLLTPLLSSLSPPPSALIYDVSLISPVLPAIQSLPYHLPAYILFPSSARMYSLFASYHTLASSAAQLGGDDEDDVLQIPGIHPPIPKSSMPPLLRIPNSLFSNIFMEDGPKLKKLNGVLINTFEALEAEALEAVNGGKVIVNDGLPPVFAVGPFEPCDFEMGDGELGSVTSVPQVEPLKWLDDQADGSVVFVSFGSRTALSREQIRELGDGLVRSGFRFLWVVKEKLVDREEEEGNLDEVVIGHELMKKMKGRGLVVKGWVAQGKILGHKAVGGIVSHCGWNSVVEAACHGVRVLAWPQHGDQRVNAEVVEMSGLGIWPKTWGWGDDQVVVNGEEIGEKIKEVMQNEDVRVKAARIGEEAKKAARVGGECEKLIKGLSRSGRRKDKSIVF